MRSIIKKIQLIVIVAIIALAVYCIAGEQLKYTIVEQPIQNVETILPELEKGTVIEQKFRSKVDVIQSFVLQPFSFGRVNQGIIDFFILDDANNVIASTSARSEDCVDYMPYTMVFADGVRVNKGKEYTLRIVLNESEGLNPTFYYTTNSQAFRDDIGSFKVNDSWITGTLCLGISGIKIEFIGTYYWYIVAIITIALLIYQKWCEYRTRQGKFTIITLICAIWKRYHFLIEQLVSRDFKVKYKRSVLGYCWSFLNPLLTVMVQYFVFSTVFRFDIENFPVYLLAGNIIFSFFTESVAQGLMSIVGNSSLITKVYVPKYIYPVTKVMSTAINLFISIIPLLLVVLITGERINFTILLLPYALMCLLIFCLGIVLALSAINVFFRDVQYLWNIVSLIWMYATPIFYPADIIPENLRFIQTVNPIYQIITFIRTILMDGVSPSPQVYLNCLIGAVISLFIGTFIFKKTQNKFALYI